MKKIIFTICLIAFMQNVFAGDHPYLQCINHTQGTTQQGDYRGAMNVLANIGDSISLYTFECNPCQVAHYGPWYLDGDSIPGSQSISIFNLVVTQSATYSIMGASFLMIYKFHICTPPAAPPATPGTIHMLSGTPNTACPGDVILFEIFESVPCATSYTWIPPAGCHILNANGNPWVTIVFDSTFTASDTVRLVANNSFGSSPQQKLKVGFKGAPAKPGIITGQNYGVCGLTVTYSVSQVYGVSYAWTIPAGATISPFQSSQIKVYYPNTPLSGQVTVTQLNGCGSSPVRVKNIYSNPATPAAISGPVTVCSGSTGNAYSISPVLSAAYYKWVGPPGCHISDGVTTSTGNSFTTTSTSVTVSYGTVTPTSMLQVKAHNNCGFSAFRKLTLIPCGPRAVTVSVDAQPGHIDFLNVFPSPVQTSVTINFKLTKPGDVEISFLDITGKQFKTGLYKNVSGEFIKNENTEALSKGIYFVRIRAGNKTVQKKFVKM